MIKILHGDCRDVLRTLDAGSVQCCVTSPPYWGLRDYGVDATVWGGDPKCEHEWGDVIAVNATNHTDKRRWNHTRNGRDEEQPAEKRVACLRTKVPQGKFCQHCNAWAGALGLEPNPDLFIEHIVEVFREVHRVLRDDGILLMNLGDSYATGAGKASSPDGGAQGERFIETGPSGYRGSRPDSPKSQVPDGGNPNAKIPLYQLNRMPLPGLKPKDLIGIPWMAAFALRADGWWLRSDIIWHKPNPMPESVTDRPTSAHEYVFLLTKSARYFWDAEAVKEPASENTHAGYSSNGAKTLANAAAFGVKPSVFDGFRPSHRNCRSVWTITTQPNGDWVESVRQVRVAWDAPGGGKTRITSPDCPLHGGHPAPAPNGSCGGHAADPDLCSGRTDIHHAQGQQAGCAPIETHLEPAIALSSLDFQGQQNSFSANPRNTETHKTARVPATSPACMPCDETISRIGDRPVQSGRPGSADHTPASKSAPDDTVDNPTSQMETGSARISAEQGSSVACEPLVCTCEHYITKTEKTSHFATFPPALAERCILAGTSAHGCCSACGTPWVRQVERPSASPTVEASSLDRYGTGDHGVHRKVGGQYQKWLDANPTRTTGWLPSCECGADVVACTVLDPFGGAGTVGLVADRLGRNATLIELNPEYCAMAERRVTKDAGLFAQVATA